MATLKTLLKARSSAFVRNQLYLALRGVGFVRHSGSGNGSVGVTGTAKAASSIVIEVTGDGSPDVSGALRWSIDGGRTWTEETEIPSSIDLTSSVGVTVALSGEASDGIQPFISGDTYKCETIVSRFPTTAWQPFSVPATLTDMAAQGISDLDALVCAIGRGGFLDLAEGDWLSLLAAQTYGLERIPASAAVVSLKVSNATQQTQAVQSGTTIIHDALGHRYRCLASATVPPNGSANIDFIAAETGNTHNVVHSPIVMESTVAGLSVSIRDDAATAGLVSPGRDAERDSELRQRCKGRWSSLAKAANSDGYASTIIAAVPTITRVLAIGSATIPGAVDISIANASGGATQTEISAATAAVESILPTCVSAVVHACETIQIDLDVSVDVATGYRDAASAAIDEAFSRLLAETPIGGHVIGARRIISQEAIVAAIMGAPGVVDCAIVTPAEDVTLLPGQVPHVGAVSVSISEV